MKVISTIVLGCVFAVYAAGTVQSCAKIPQALLPGGYDKYSPYELMYQSLHMAAAAACRGSTPSGGTGPWANVVLSMDPIRYESCNTVCKTRGGAYTQCGAQLSIQGYPKKATAHAQVVGLFYNYGCGGTSAHMTGEARASAEDIMNTDYFAFCCCRKP